MIDLIPLVSGIVGIGVGFVASTILTSGAMHDMRCQMENAQDMADRFGFELAETEALRRQAVEAMIELNASNERMASQLEAYRIKEEKRRAANFARVSKSNRTRYARLRAAKAAEEQAKQYTGMPIVTIRSYSNV